MVLRPPGVCLRESTRVCSWRFSRQVHEVYTAPRRLGDEVEALHVHVEHDAARLEHGSERSASALPRGERRRHGLLALRKDLYVELLHAVLQALPAVPVTPQLGIVLPEQVFARLLGLSLLRELRAEAAILPSRCKQRQVAGEIDAHEIREVRTVFVADL